MSRRTGLTNDVRWRDGQEKSTNQQGTKQPRTSGGGSQVGLLFHPSGAKNLDRLVGLPLLGRGVQLVKRTRQGKRPTTKKRPPAVCQATVIFESAPSRNRTENLLIKSQLL
jgi:hypothetical protein